MNKKQRCALGCGVIAAISVVILSGTGGWHRKFYWPSIRIPFTDKDLKDVRLEGNFGALALAFIAFFTGVGIYFSKDRRAMRVLGESIDS